MSTRWLVECVIDLSKYILNFFKNFIFFKCRRILLSLADLRDTNEMSVKNADIAKEVSKKLSEEDVAQSINNEEPKLNGVQNGEKNHHEYVRIQYIFYYHSIDWSFKLVSVGRWSRLWYQ